MVRGKKKGPAMTKRLDDQAFRNQDIFRRFLQYIGLTNDAGEALADDLSARDVQPIGIGRRETNVRPDNLMTPKKFIENGNNQEYMVIEPAFEVSSIPGPGKDTYCIAQQANHPRYYVFLKFDPVGRVWGPLLPAFLSACTRIKGGIEYKVTDDDDIHTENRLRKRN